MNAKEIERIVSSLDKIPTLPVIYSKLGKLLQSPDTTIAAVSNIISEDQVIAAKVLKFVNSAFYGFPQRGDENYYKLVEDKTLQLHGMKTLITHNYYDRESFWKSFNKVFYDAVKRRTDPKNLFRDLYEKTNYKE